MVKHSAKVYTVYPQKVVIIFLLVTLCVATAPILTLGKPDNIAEATVDGSAYVVLETTSLRVLKGQNIASRLPMASTTKAMTALVVLENANVDDVVTIPKAAVGIEGSSIYLKEGEKLTVKELLYGLMLRSGNDAAVALALHVSGSIENFAEKMNKKAEEWCLNNTHFANPHGLSAKEHYTSAYDLAVIAAKALQNPTFREIVSTKFIEIPTEEGKEPRYFANKNKILYSYEGATGVKTGYTMEAGRCLIASSERNGMEVVAVALNHYDYFDLCASLMDYAHDSYELKKIVDADLAYSVIKVNKNRKIKSAELHVQNSIVYPVKKNGSEIISTEVETSDEITAPHKRTEPCGEVKIFIDNRLLFTEKLFTIYDIERKSLF